MEEHWDKKKKIGDFVFDFNKLEDLVDKLMKQMEPQLPKNSDKPVIFGFSMRLGEDGNPVIEGIGESERVALEKKTVKQQLLPKAIEPLIDVQSREKKILITVELPGVEKKDIRLNVLDEHSLEIIVAGQNSFYKRIIVPESIRQQKAEAELKNGILEISLDRLPEKRGKEIKVK